jgi:hypothetical protein
MIAFASARAGQPAEDGVFLDNSRRLMIDGAEW